MKHTLFSLLTLVTALFTASYAYSEYVDYRIKSDLAYELNIHPSNIAFLYSKDEECEEGETLYDSDLGICIHNSAFGHFTDTDVELDIN